MAKTLVEYIEDNYNYRHLDKTLIDKWLSITPILEDKNMVVEEKEITVTEAERYRFDFYGLLRHVLRVDNKFLYPHTIANGYDCSYDYNGNQIRIKLLDNSVLTRYYEMFIRE